MNCFTFIGNITRDLELRYTPNGTATVTYVVAVDRVYFVAQERREETDFFPVTTYGRQAENDAKYLKKGYRVGISCEVHSWFKAVEKRGGFNFEPFKVDYLGAPSGAGSARPVSTPSPEVDDWLRDYDRSEGTGAPGARPPRS